MNGGSVVALGAVVAVLWGIGAGVGQLAGPVASSGGGSGPEPECRADLACWGNRWNGAADVACRALARDRLGPVDWRGVVPFDRFSWADGPGGPLAFYGMGTGGDGRAVRVRCRFDPAAGALAVTRAPLP